MDLFKGYSTIFLVAFKKKLLRQHQPAFTAFTFSLKRSWLSPCIISFNTETKPMREGPSLLSFFTLGNSSREVEHQPKVTQAAGGLGTQILNPSYIIPVGVLHPWIWRDNFIMNSYRRDLSILRFCITNLLQIPRNNCTQFWYCENSLRQYIVAAYEILVP